MSAGVQTAFIAGCGGMLGWGLADFFAKHTIGRIGDVASLVWGHLFGTGALVLGALVYLAIAGAPTGLPHTGASWLVLLTFGAGQAAVYLLVYKAFSKGPVSLLSPIFASYSGLAAVLSIVFFSEAVGLGTLGTLVLMFAGVMLVSLEGRFASASTEKRLPPGVTEALIGAGLAAVWTVGWHQVIGGKSWFSYTVTMYAVMTVVIVVFATARGVKLARPRGRLAFLLAGIGLAEVAAYLAIGIGFSETSHTSLVAVLSGAFALPTVLLARLFLRERMNATRLVGIGAVIVASMLLPVTYSLTSTTSPHAVGDGPRPVAAHALLWETHGRRFPSPSSLVRHMSPSTGQ
jgi:uncharacterized membrane protein